MKFSYSNNLPKLINAGIFTGSEEALLRKAQELPLNELIQMIKSLNLDVNFTDKERRRISDYALGKSTKEIAQSEGVSVSALKHVHRKIEVMRESLFLYWMTDIYPETKDFELSLLHSYFSRSVIPSNLAFRYLRVRLSGRETPEWEVGLNQKSIEVKKSSLMIHQFYANPYLLAVDLYLALEKNEGPLKLLKTGNSTNQA